MTDSNAPKPWHQDELFWSTMRAGIFEPHRWEAARVEVTQLLELLKLPPHAAVLDMPCGPGRHLVHLAAKGLRVTGVDLTQSYLDEASERLRQLQLTAELVRADMRTLVRPASFDAVLHLYSSFGYFDDPSDDQRLLQNMHVNLRPGGCAVLELLVRDGAAIDPANVHELADGTHIVESASSIGSDGVAARDWSAPGLNRLWRAKHRLYRVAELEQMLRVAGFRAIQTFGDFAGNPFSASLSNAVLVARV